MKTKIKGGRRRFSIFILVLWIPFIPFIILDEDLPIETKIFILVTNLIGWSLFIFIFIDKEPLYRNEIGEKILQFLKNAKLILISFITAVIVTIVISFYDLFFLIIFLGILAISFTGVILSNLFFPLEYMVSVFPYSKITSQNFLKILPILYIFSAILAFLIFDFIAFLLFILYILLCINIGLYVVARIRIKYL